jgi:AcrR family transcriptional regulator
MVIKNKQNLLYNSWVKLFWKYWVKRVSIDMVVKEAWVAKGTFYLYYKNKETLYEHIMDDILSCWTSYMTDLVNTIPDVKERFYLHMIGSLWFFQKNEIVKSLIEWNTDYYIWKINDEYLNNKHIEFMKLLLWNEFKDEEFVEFVANIKWFFANVINHKNCFTTNEEFENFVMNFAAVIVNGLFSDYAKIKSKKTFKEITSCVPKIKK